MCMFHGDWLLGDDWLTGARGEIPLPFVRHLPVICATEFGCTPRPLLVVVMTGDGHTLTSQ